MKLRSSVTILTTFFVLIILIIFIKPQNIFNAIVKIPIEFFLFTAILFTFDIILRAIRWNVLLEIQGIKDIGLKNLLAPMFSSSLLNLVTPARAGDAVRLYALKKNNDISYSVGLSVIVVEQILTLFTLLMVGFGALILIIISGVTVTSDLQKILANSIPILVLVYFVGTVGILFLMFIDARNFIPLLKKFPIPQMISNKGEAFLNNFGEGAKNLKQKPVYLLSAIIVSSSIWIIEGIMLWVFSLLLIDSSFEFEIALFASVMGNITFILPLLPGSVGTYEVFVGVFISLSKFYKDQDAVIIALVDRGVKTVILLILGGYSTLVIQAQRLKRKEILEEAKLNEKQLIE